MKLLSFNVRVWTRDLDRAKSTYWFTRAKAMRKMLLERNPDIICFQEMYFPMSLFIPFTYRRVGFSIHHPIYVRRGMHTSKHKLSIRWESALVEGYNIINVHTHWNRKIMESTVAAINENIKPHTIAAGDFNNPLYALKDAGLNMRSAREMVGSMTAQSTFIHFTRSQSGEIDHAFLTDDISIGAYRVIYASYGEGRMSDHFPIEVEIYQR